MPDHRSCKPLLALLVGPLLAAPGQVHTKIAFVSHPPNELYVWDSEEGAAKRLTSDGINKYSPTWSPDGTKVAYLANTKPNIIFPNLVVVDTQGRVQATQAIFPGLPPNSTERVWTPRDIRIYGWLDEQHIMLSGTVNPQRCVFMVMDTTTGAISHGTSGDCRSFQPSPDHQHFMSVETVIGEIPEGWSGQIYLGNDMLYPRPYDMRGVNFVTAPSWSPDSRTIAVVEKVRATGAKNLVLVDLSGKAEHIPLPASSGEFEKPEWVGDQVVVGDGRMAVAVAAAEGRLRPATADLTDVIAKRGPRREALQAIRNAGEAKALKLAPDGSAWSVDVWIDPRSVE